MSLPATRQPSISEINAERDSSNGVALVPVTSRVYARIGLLGNPSDGFFGKTISLSLQNFFAEVTLIPKPPGSGIEFVPHPQHDRLQYADMFDLVNRVQSAGYYGGIRLLMAACKRFHEHCRERGRPLPDGRDDFSLAYDTNIPRQAGLSGSSAIACAALNCLFAHYGVPAEEVAPLPERPNLVLSVEQELGITAGLQDRVIQVYGGLVYMDFDKSRFKRRGHGKYTPLPPELLPRLWLVYCDNPSDSGKVHSDVKRRWLEGDPEIREKMELVAACAEEGRVALEMGDLARFGQLMDRNFDLRREMFGDKCLGELNLKMITTARSVGAHAKFTGSGGAIVVFCPLGEEQEQLMIDMCTSQGFTVVEVMPAPPTSAMG